MTGKKFGSMLITMKRPFSLTSPLAITAISAISVVLLLVLSGCGTLTGPPKPWEQKYYDVTTNTIEMVNWYTNQVTITNVETVLVQQPVVGTTNFVTITNLIPILAYQTNVVSLTNTTETYLFKPNQESKDAVGVVRDVGGFAGPGAGNIAGLVGAAFFGFWGMWRSRKAQSVAASLSQAIEVSSEIIKGNPATAHLEPKYKAWMTKHQAETGTINAVLKILKTTTSNRDAKDVADALIKLTT